MLQCDQSGNTQRLASQKIRQNFHHLFTVIAGLHPLDFQKIDVNQLGNLGILDVSAYIPKTTTESLWIILTCDILQNSACVYIKKKI